jgi:CRISPR type I-E-associated protein CasB/Cse2
MTDQEEEVVDFVAYLLKMENSLGKRFTGTLRRGFGRDLHAVHELDRYIASWLPPREISQDVIYMVAVLFGFHPENISLGDLGTHLAELPEAKSTPAERNLNLLIDSPWSHVWSRLCVSFRQLESANIPVNYSQLYKDLMGWDSDKRYVQKKWSRHYYQYLSQKSAN